MNAVAIGIEPDGREHRAGCRTRRGGDVVRIAARRRKRPRNPVERKSRLLLNRGVPQLGRVGHLDPGGEDRCGADHGGRDESGDEQLDQREPALAPYSRGHWHGRARHWRMMVDTSTWPPCRARALITRTVRTRVFAAGPGWILQRRVIAACGASK